MYAEALSSTRMSGQAKAFRPAEKTFVSDGRAATPHRCFTFASQGGRLTPEGLGEAPPVPFENFEPDVFRRAMVEGQAVLRPTTDHLGRPVILAYMPEAQVLLVSMLYFGDALRQAARGFGMGNLAARVSKALVENGSLRAASRSLGISHMTAASEMRDAMRAADVHSQSGLVDRLAGTWLSEDSGAERACALLMKTYGLKPRDARIASLRARGLSRPQAASVLGVSQWAMETSCSHIFATLGVTKAPELTRLVADLMLTAELVERKLG